MNVNKAVTRDLSLRELDPATVTQTNLLLAARAEGMTVSCLTHGQHYAALAAWVDERPCTIFVPLQQLIDHWLHDATLPADAMDREILYSFMVDSFRQEGLPSPSHSLLWDGPKGYAHEQDYHTPLLRLKGGPFDLFMPYLPTDLSTPALPIDPQLSVALRLVLGELRLAASELVGLSPGDVICVPPQSGLAWAGAQSIFSFHIHGDNVMIEATLDNGRGNDAEGDTPDEKPIDARFDAHEEHAVSESLTVANLPVTLSFVLSRCNLRVGQISALQPGMTLPLEHPVPYVDVMAGPLRLARGELVRVGEDLGVEIIDVMTQNIHDPGSTPS